MNDIMYLYNVIFLDIIVLHNIISLIWVSIGCFGCFGWTVSDGFRCSEQAEVIVVLKRRRKYVFGGKVTLSVSSKHP